MRGVSRLSVLGLIITALGVLTGCSVIGYLIGAHIDSKHKGPVRVQGWELLRLKQGARIRVVLRDGAEVSGVYGGLDFSAGEYAARYAAARARNCQDLSLPVFGDPVVVTRSSGKVANGEFLGFDYTSLYVKPDGKATVKVPLTDVASVTAPGGDPVSGAKLASANAAGQVPIRSRLIVDKREVPLEDVSYVEFQRTPNRGKVIGFLVGAAIDALVIVAVAQAADGGPLRCGDCGYSCPFVYSYDAQRYVLDAEVFGGAIFKAAARSDWASLDHLAETDGTYRIRLTNEQPEIQYVDEVKLWAIDQPDGTRVVPSLDGRLHTLASAFAPTHAADLRGRDVLRAVRARDDEVWVSNPFGRDSENPGDIRDGLVLEFPRSADAKAVTLVFDVRSTPWASHLLGRVLSLQGRDLGAWTARMNGDAGARGAFLSALRREGLPRLGVWNGETWQDTGFLANLGPAISREQAVRLDIGGFSGDTLRVRLDSTAGMWMVDSVEADYGQGSRPEVTALSPIVARMHRGEDIRGLLAAVDGRRYVMNPGDSAELVFEAPGRTSGRRSFVLKTTGYYTILVPAEGEPQPALFAKLVNEPGAFGRYSLDLLASDLREELARFASSAE